MCTNSSYRYIRVRTSVWTKTCLQYAIRSFIAVQRNAKKITSAYFALPQSKFMDPLSLTVSPAVTQTLNFVHTIYLSVSHNSQNKQGYIPKQHRLIDFVIMKTK